MVEFNGVAVLESIGLPFTSFLRVDGTLITNNYKNAYSSLPLALRTLVQSQIASEFHEPCCRVPLEVFDKFEKGRKGAF